MAKNELWFYKGVRYAKDGRYACYCPTPAKKRTVLLQNALVTLSRDNGKNDVLLTPWNMRTREITVRIGNGWAGNAGQALNFINSNYLIVHDMQTGYYYNYYIDYIEPIQQLKEYPAPPHVNPEEISLNLYNVGDNEQTYRVGISLDYWQTFFFAMHTNIDSPNDRPQYCAPHSTLSDTVNVVDTPNMDFANISRTNMHNILSDIGNVENVNAFRALLIPQTYSANNIIDHVSIVEMLRLSTDRQEGYAILLKIQLSNLEPSELSQEFRGTLWVMYRGLMTATSISLLSSRHQAIIRQLNNILTSTGRIATNYTFDTIKFGDSAGIIKRGQNYSVEEAYFIPSYWAESMFPNITQNNSPINLAPANFPDSTTLFGSYPIPVNAIQGKGISYWSPTNSLISYTISPPRVTYSYNSLVNIIKKAYPTVTDSVIPKIIPYLTVGTRDDRFLPAYPSINGCRSTVDGKICPTVENVNLTPNTPIFWVQLELTAYSIKLSLSNGVTEVNITSDFKLPLRQVTDNSEIEREKQTREQGNIAQGVSLLTTAVGAGISFFTGNIPGAVMGSAQLTQQAISFNNSVTNAPNFDKMKKSASITPELQFSQLPCPFVLKVPIDIVNINNPNIIFSYNDEFTEIGIELGGAIYRNNPLTDNSAYQPIGYIEMGALIRDMQQEPAEVLERRFREGVTFWYE